MSITKGGMRMTRRGVESWCGRMNKNTKMPLQVYKGDERLEVGGKNVKKLNLIR